MFSAETLDLLNRGGMLGLCFVAIGWLVVDRNRLLKSMGDKDEIIAAKDEKLAALSEKTLVNIAEFKILLQSVVDIVSKRR